MFVLSFGERRSVLHLIEDEDAFHYTGHCVYLGLMSRHLCTCARVYDRVAHIGMRDIAVSASRLEQRLHPRENLFHSDKSRRDYLERFEILYL